MIGACSIPTGQISTQALHCMQDQIVSTRTLSSPTTIDLEAAPSEFAASRLADHTSDASPGHRRVACSRSSRITSRGESGRPVALAGQTSWHLPQRVQASS